MRSTQPLSFYLGCGEKHIHGFINIDSREGPNVDLVCDIANLQFLETIDTIYMCFLCFPCRHVRLFDVGVILKNLNRLLIPSRPSIYISVPDFEVLSALYLSGKVPLTSIVRAIHGGQEYPENTHYMSYDSTLLTSILIDCGFSSVLPYSPENLPGGFSDTSTYKIGGKLRSLNLCAIN